MAGPVGATLVVALGRHKACPYDNQKDGAHFHNNDILRGAALGEPPRYKAA